MHEKDKTIESIPETYNFLIVSEAQYANHFDHLGFLPKIATNHTMNLQRAIQTRDSEKLKNNQY